MLWVRSQNIFKFKVQQNNWKIKWNATLGNIHTYIHTYAYSYCVYNYFFRKVITHKSRSHATLSIWGTEFNYQIKRDPRTSTDHYYSSRWYHMLSLRQDLQLLLIKTTTYVHIYLTCIYVGWVGNSKILTFAYSVTATLLCVKHNQLHQIRVGKTVLVGSFDRDRQTTSNERAKQNKINTSQS